MRYNDKSFRRPDPSAIIRLALIFHIRQHGLNASRATIIAKRCPNAIFFKISRFKFCRQLKGLTGNRRMVQNRLRVKDPPEMAKSTFCLVEDDVFYFPAGQAQDVIGSPYNVYSYLFQFRISSY